MRGVYISFCARNIRTEGRVMGYQFQRPHICWYVQIRLIWTGSGLVIRLSTDEILYFEEFLVLLENGPLCFFKDDSLILNFHPLGEGHRGFIAKGVILHLWFFFGSVPVFLGPVTRK